MALYLVQSIEPGMASQHCWVWPSTEKGKHRHQEVSFGRQSDMAATKRPETQAAGQGRETVMNLTTAATLELRKRPETAAGQ